MVSRFVAAVFICLWSMGCGDDAEGCVSSTECESSQMCVNGSCTARASFDAGRADASMTDGGVLDDGGPLDDAGGMDSSSGSCGAPCDTGNPCEEGAFDCESGEPVCAAIGAAAAGILCRDAAGDCDAQEQCDGSSSECPADDRIGEGTECRGSSGACDVAESCDGESPACPLDGFASTGTTCPDGFCDGSGICSDTCTPGAACDPGVPCFVGQVDCSTGTPSCELAGNDDNGTTCRATENGVFGACGSFTTACDEQGSQSRSVTNYACDDGICAASVSEDSRSCSRGTSGVGCGMTINGAWGECGGFTNTCDETGTRTRTVTTQLCSMGICDATSSEQSEGCSRVTAGLSCGEVITGRWSICGGFTTTCDETGTHSRSVTTPTCASGACGSVGTTQTEECGRTTTGDPCPGIAGQCNSYSCGAGTCQTMYQCRRSERCCPETGCQDSEFLCAF